MKKLVFMGAFTEAWEEVLRFLSEKEYQDTAMLEHMREVLEGTKKERS